MVAVYIEDRKAPEKNVRLEQGTPGDLLRDVEHIAKGVHLGGDLVANEQQGQNLRGRHGAAWAKP
jgi:hypothetical protein